MRLNYYRRLVSKMKVILTCLLYFSIFHLCDNYRILGLFPVQGKSHMMMFESLMKGLAEKGHEVDVLSHFPLKRPAPRYNDISVLGTIPIFVNNISISLREHIDNYYELVKFIIFQGGVAPCQAVLNSTVAKELKNSKKKYDLVITEIFGSDCMLGFAHHFKIPVIGITTSVDLPWGGVRIGNPDNPSYIPNYFVPYMSRMTLVERCINTVLLLAIKLGYGMSHHYSNSITREFFGPYLPDLKDLVYNTSLVFVNSHFSINIARPIVPNFIEVGGLHIQPPKPLSKYFEDSLNIMPRYKGVIYLSTGSMILTETFPSYKLRALFEAFRELPYKVLWKADRENLPKDLDIPLNIQFEPWMPQIDILCHPNVKLFVTHGGLMGTQEGVYCGVPRLGIPLFADQALNLKSSEAMGLTIMVDYDGITKENILNAARSLLEDPKYEQNAERVAKLFRDRPLSAMDIAIYWTEYIIKHNGAPHLRTIGADLLWYQYHFLDVAAILLGLLIAVATAIYYLITCILKTVMVNRHKCQARPKKD